MQRPELVQGSGRRSTNADHRDLPFAKKRDVSVAIATTAKLLDEPLDLTFFANFRMTAAQEI